MTTQTATIQQPQETVIDNEPRSGEVNYVRCLTNDPKYLAPIRKLEMKLGFVTPIRWQNTILISLFHILVSFYLLHFLYNGQRCLKQTLILEIIFGQMAAFGITAGAHRLWTHRSYKVKTPLKILLLIFYATAGQNKLYHWVRDHRLHHKKSETSADPHDVSRGFFFSHVGWLMMKKHPDVLSEGSKIDMSDISGDPLLNIFDRNFNLLKLLFCFLLPAVLPVLLFGETWTISILAVLVRYLLTLNFTWSVNSFAHLYGFKPYDRKIMPAENFAVSLVAMGEGWHNYHHTFPWDYKASELPYFFNVSTLFLDAAAYIGQAYDMKQASPELIKATAEKNGDSSWKTS
ncbi:acyl-CoA Delta-9 desaturase-like isoform X1 [Leptidea sinapis]|uniref:acyl-CoA Delta-9 desaturase-like isoform X1 n=2 Tax=Leptidea sinapis TaxID=189913 RepID=UPI00212AC9AF|nr:acyl-CoA Delta-9 desaturase-like isoform X1 [Leptidea sinapis]